MPRIVIRPRSRALPALVLAVGLTAGATALGAGQAAAEASADSGFHNVINMAKWGTVTQVESPREGLLHVLGLGPGVVKVATYAVSGTSATLTADHQVPAPFTGAWGSTSATGNGSTWMLVYAYDGTTFTTDARYSALYRVDDAGVPTEVPLPTFADPGWVYLNHLAVEGDTVAVSGRLQHAAGGDPVVVTATLAGGTWTTAETGPAGAAPVAPGSLLVQGHYLDALKAAPTATTVDVTDLTASPPYVLGSLETRPADGHVRFPGAMTATAPTAVTVWGRDYDPATSAFGGTCDIASAGTTTPCAAPGWGVTSAVRLPDGRTLLGGVDKPSFGMAQYAFAEPDGTFTPVSTEATSWVYDLAVDPAGTTAYAIVDGISPYRKIAINALGSTAPTRTDTPTATDSGTPVPTPTVTSTPTSTTTPAPTDTSTPVPTDTTTPVPTGTATPTATSTKTKTKKPKPTKR